MQEKIKIVKKQAYMKIARELPVWQNALIGFTVWIWLISVVDDIYQVVGIGSFEILYLAGFPFLLCIFAAVFLLPLSMVIWGIQQIYDYMKNCKSGIPFYKHIFVFLGWLICAAVLIVAPFLIFLIIDLQFTITTIPFLTTVSTLLWLGIGISMTKNQPIRKSLTLISLMLLVILSVKYMDWNSRKSFLRDLYHVKVGMTGTEVKHIMGKYDEQVTQYAPLTYEYLQYEFTGEEIFRHTDEGWGNADWGIIKFQDGRVVQVEFSHD